MRMRAVRTMIASAALLLAAAAPLAAQDARIVGRVTDDVGNAVEGARVVLVTSDETAPERTATSGQTGGFQFAELAPGTYTVRATSAGGATRELRVQVDAGELETVVARLRPGRAPRLAANEPAGQ